MNCNKIQELMVEYLLAELPSASISEIDAHLRTGCPSCLAVEKEFSQGMDMMFDSIPAKQLSHSQCEAILASSKSDRLRGRVELESARQIAGTSSRLRQIASAIVALAAGALVMMTLSQIVQLPKEESRVVSVPPSGTFAVDPTRLTQDTQLAEEKYSRSLLVSMKRANTSSRIEGRILWDALSQEVHFYGKGIPTTPNGTKYVLWLLDAQERTLDSKVLSVGADGTCKATASASMGDIARIFITVESNVASFETPSKNVELTLDAGSLRPFSL